MADSDSNHHHDHDHDHEEGEDEGAAQALRDALDAARGGLRSLVQRVIETLDDGVLYVPLAEDIPDIPEDEDQAFDELSFRPHMLLDNDENAYAVAYTEPALVENVQEALCWSTDGEELKFVRLPARSVLELALADVEDVSVGGLAIDPSTDRELVLGREEVQHILSGQAIPLVGYIEELPESDEELPIVEGAEPPDPKLLEALDHAKAKIQDLVGYRVDTTFHPERDREPHLTITLYLSRPDAPRGAIAEELMELVDPLLPPPGYADLVFRDAPN